MDFVESSKSQWTGRYSWGDENQASQGLSITGSKILTNYEQYLGIEHAHIHAQPGERSAFRLHAVLQLHRHVLRVLHAIR